MVVDRSVVDVMILGIMSIQDTGPVQPVRPEIWVTFEETGSGFNARRKYTAHFDNPNSASGTLYYSVNGGSSYSSTSISANGRYSLQVLTLRRGESGSVDLKAYLVINGETSPTASYISNYSFPL